MKLAKTFSILLAACAILVQCSKENPPALPFYPVPNPPIGVNAEPGVIPPTPGANPPQVQRPTSPQVSGAVIPGRLIEVNRLSAKVERLEIGAKVDVFVAGMGDPNNIRCEFKSHPGFGTEMPRARWAGLPLALTSEGAQYGTVGPSFESKLNFYQKDSANLSFRVDFSDDNAKIFRALYRIRTRLVSGPICTARMEICRNQDLRPTGETEGGKRVYSCANENRWSEIRGLPRAAGLLAEGTIMNWLAGTFQFTGFKLFLVGPTGAIIEERIGMDGLLPATD